MGKLNVFAHTVLANACGERMPTIASINCLSMDNNIHKMRNGASLEQALKSALYELDGFYTFVVGL